MKEIRIAFLVDTSLSMNRKLIQEKISRIDLAKGFVETFLEVRFSCSSKCRQSKGDILLFRDCRFLPFRSSLLSRYVLSLLSLNQALTRGGPLDRLLQDAGDTSSNTS